jgi:hypothetical protein
VLAWEIGGLIHKETAFHIVDHAECKLARHMPALTSAPLVMSK